MKILVAPNAFKGSLSALAAARAMARGARSVFAKARVELMPISDGGDGIAEALLAAWGGRFVSVPVLGPLGERRRASFALTPKGAVIEMARASGLALVPERRRDAMRATSFGTGQLIAAALKAGARRVLIGMGGSASNDGGAGMASALGARLLDRRGRPIPRGAAGLSALARIEKFARPEGVEIVAISDVRNPLLGPRGSARVYGPQKGASPAQVEQIELGLELYAGIISRDLGVSVARVPGAGAAGGLGAGLIAFLGAKIVPGAAFVLDEIGARRRLRGAAAVLTGEGRLDETSFYGKAPVELARLARELGVPTAFVCGQLDEKARRRLGGPSVSFAELGAAPEDSRRRASYWCARAAAEAVRRLGLACLAALAVSMPAAAETPIEAIDRHYFARHMPGELEKSLERAQAEIEKSPDSAAPLWRLGRSLARKGERVSKKEKIKTYEKAEQLLRRAVELDPKNAEAHFWLGVSLGRIGQVRGILKSLFLVGPIRREMEIVLALDPAHGGAHNVLAEILWQLPRFAGGNKKKALEHFEKALELSPRYTANHVALARAYKDLAREKDALKVLDALFMVSDPADPGELHQNLEDGKRLLEELKPTD